MSEVLPIDDLGHCPEWIRMDRQIFRNIKAGPGGGGAKPRVKYRVYDKDMELLFEGSAKEVAEEYGLYAGDMSQYAKKKIFVRKKYNIRKVKG